LPNFVNDASKMVVLRWIAFARGTLRPPNSFSHMDPFHADSMNDSVVCTSGSEEEGLVVVAVAVIGIPTPCLLEVAVAVAATTTTSSI
jgi:hypothetical protein